MKVLFFLFFTGLSFANEHDSFLENFFNDLPYCQIYDFSSYGNFRELEPNIFENITADKLELLKEEHKFFFPLISHYKNYFSGNQVLAKKVSREFLLDLISLRNVMSINHVSSLKLSSIIQVADKIIKARQAQEGYCYKITTINEGRRNYPEWVKISSKNQEKISDMFTSPVLIGDALTKKESEMLSEGRLNLAEITELRAIRSAVALFERNTKLKDDVGGWAGNKPNKGKISTFCGEEASTYYYFLKSLEHEGLISLFNAQNYYHVKSVAYGLNNHAGNILTSRRTDEVFILDSWIFDGGSPASILTLPQWEDDHYSEEMVADTVSHCLIK